MHDGPALFWGHLSVVLSASVLAAAFAPAHSPSEPPILLRDVADVSGITFRLEQNPTPQKHLIETMPGGLAAFDYNADGLTDLYFTNGASIPALAKTGPSYWNRLYRNDGGMKFTDVTEQAGVSGSGYSMGAAVADYDNDGNVDLFVAGVERNILYHNRGNGTFEDVTGQAGIRGHSWSIAAGWLDFDRDGLLDLFVVNYVKWSAGDTRFCGDRPRNIRVYCHPQYYAGLVNTLYRNRGHGSFEDVSARTGIADHVGKGMSIGVADYDGDGWMDVFVTNDTVPNFLFRNVGGKRFEEAALVAGVAVSAHGKAISSMGAEFRDYDNDGRPDIHVTALAGEGFPLFHNDGAGQFTDVTERVRLTAATLRRSGWGNALVDLDNDGWKDLFTANSHVNDRIEAFEAHQYREPNSVFHNVDGAFRDMSRELGRDFQVPRAHRGAVAADLNNDGRLDIVATSLGDRVEMWQNQSPGANSWIVVRLSGTRSNRDGIGARVSIGTQTVSMTTTAGYASSVHAGVHFGLGRMAKIDRIEIVWPSGAVQTIENAAVNQVLQVREPTKSRRAERSEP
jgi:enediyne biosynthesis protein E4